jgi:hypothetical protein
MDLHTRQLLDEAIALDDKMRVEHACWEAKRAERERAQARTQLVYKVHEPKVAAQQQRITPMVDAVDKAWLQARLDAFASIIGEEVAKTQNEIVRKLREEIAGLRAEVESLRQQQKKNKDLSGVVECGHVRRNYGCPQSAACRVIDDGLFRAGHPV